METSNLHRQLLHQDKTVGQPKTQSAADRLQQTNPHIRVIQHPEGVTVANAVELFANYDVIVDGTDNFTSRYLNNDAAMRVERPLVFGSVYRFEGQLSVFAPHLGGSCYRCLFPEPPPEGSVPGCGEIGVMGALCGVIGSWQALETIKLITGAGTPLINKLFTYDALNQQISTFSMPRRDDCRCQRQGETTTTPLDPEDYASAVCAPPAPLSSMSTESESFPLEISVSITKQLLDDASKNTRLIDVREPHEVQICKIEGATFIPMRQIPENVSELPRDKHLLIYCHHGARSMRVVEYLRDQGFMAVTNVGGGINAWADEIEPGMLRY